MPRITDLVTASNLSEYYSATETNAESIGERLFPARKQLGLRLDFIKGANNQSVALKASAFDTQASLRDRMPIQLSSENMPFFREGMLVKEEDRQQLNMLASTGNQQLVDTVLSRIYDDQTNLIRASKSRFHAMRMQVLATGKLAVDSNGVKREFDYGISEANQGQAAVDWASADADPIGDIDNAIEHMAELGIAPAGIVLNSKTYGQLRKAKATATRINGTVANQPTRNQVMEFLRDEYSLAVELVDGSYTDDDGVAHKYFPDGRVTFVPNQSVGYTVFGTTPEESDLQTGASNAEVNVVETGVAVTTLIKEHPVNVETIVSMINLPSFEGANLVYLLQTDLDAEAPVGDGEEAPLV